MFPCITKKYIGMDCMGCGLQRATLLLTKGEFIDAFKMYPAIYPLVVFFVFLGISYVTKIPNSSKITAVLSILCVFSIVSAYIYKLRILF